jgi:hypothetical protein
LIWENGGYILVQPVRQASPAVSAGGGFRVRLRPVP